jgi:single-strand DNA-binding protein
MAGYINKAIIIGNLGQDPEIKAFDNGGKIANLSIATTDKWKDKTTGEQRERTEWHRVTVRQNGTSKIIDGFIGKYVKKGNKVYVEGQLQTRKWQDQNGNDRYTTEIIVSGPNSTLELLEKPPARDQTAPASDQAGPPMDAGDQIESWD